MGNLDDIHNLLPAASGDDRHWALALSSQFGHAEIVQMLLDAGEDPSRYNPVGCHSHSTPLHQAALAGHIDVVRLLVERGARLDFRGHDLARNTRRVGSTRRTRRNREVSAISRVRRGCPGMALLRHPPMGPLRPLAGCEFNRSVQHRL